MSCPRSSQGSVSLGNSSHKNQLSSLATYLYVTAYITWRISLTDTRCHPTSKPDWPKINLPPCSFQVSLGIEWACEGDFSLAWWQERNVLLETVCGHRWASCSVAKSSALSPDQGLHLNQSIEPQAARTSINRDKTSFGYLLLVSFFLQLNYAQNQL